MPGKAHGTLVLSDDERATLTRWARRATSAQALAMRARIVLACAEGTPNTHVAAQLGVSRDMVGKWRSRFLAGRLQGLSDEPRPGAPRKITDEQVETVIIRTLEEAPANGDTHWSTRSMATATGLTQTAISRIWRAFGLKPHLVDTWKLSTDPQFINKVRDIVGLYLDPPVGAMVLAVDEKTQIQALDRTAPVLPMMPGGRLGALMTTSATAPRACSPPWTWPPVRSSARPNSGIATKSSCGFSRPSTSRHPAIWTCT
jgi:transposase